MGLIRIQADGPRTHYDDRCHQGRYWFSGRSKKLFKKQMNRLMRRQAKRDPENAPVKNRYNGWYW